MNARIVRSCALQLLTCPGNTEPNVYSRQSAYTTKSTSATQTDALHKQHTQTFSLSLTHSLICYPLTLPSLSPSPLSLFLRLSLSHPTPSLSHTHSPHPSILFYEHHCPWESGVGRCPSLRLSRKKDKR